MNLNQFVKFVRGTPTAWSNLADNKKNEDTLYFICEKDSSVGNLYLGKTLISGNASSDNLENIIVNNVGNKDLLVYDSLKKSWVNKPLAEAISTFNGIGTFGLVPVPKSTDVNKFLSSDGTWKSAFTSNSFDTNVFEVNNNKVSFLNFSEANEDSLLKKNNAGKIEWISPANLLDLTGINTTIQNLQDTIYTKEEVNSLIGNISSLSRVIINSLDEIDVDKEDAMKHIYLISNNSNKLNNSYDEYLVVKSLDGTKFIEKVGDWSIDLDGYVSNVDFEALQTKLNNFLGDNFQNNIPLSDLFITKTQWETEIGDLSKLLTEVDEDSEEKHTLVDQINFLTNLLKWGMIET